MKNILLFLQASTSEVYGDPLEDSQKESYFGNVDPTGLRRPLPPGDPRQRRPDVTLAKKKLSWQPTVSLKEGLKLSLPYFQSL